MLSRSITRENYFYDNEIGMITIWQVNCGGNGLTDTRGQRPCLPNFDTAHTNLTWNSGL